MAEAKALDGLLDLEEEGDFETCSKPWKHLKSQKATLLAQTFYYGRSSVRPSGDNQRPAIPKRSLLTIRQRQQNLLELSQLNGKASPLLLSRSFTQASNEYMIFLSSFCPFGEREASRIFRKSQMASAFMAHWCLP